MCPASRIPGAAALAFALAFGSVAQAADESAPVPKPEVKVGEWWTYRNTDYPTNIPRTYNHHERVTFVGSNEILTVNRGDKDSVWTGEWNALAHGGSGVTYNKPRDLFKFPLSAGATYRASYEVVTRRGSGALSRFEDTVKVVGWEDVVVPAGKFRALKLETTGTYQRLDTRAGGWTRREIWYAPEVKRWVKWTYVEGPGAPNPGLPKNVEELIQYKVEQ